MTSTNLLMVIGGNAQVLKKYADDQKSRARR